MRNNCIYYVEGDCEKTLINALKEHPSKVIPGKVKVFNIIKNEVTRSQLISIKPGTTVVFVFDTDVRVTDHLKNNIARFRAYCVRTKIVFLPQVLNFEDEIVRCTDVSEPTDLTKSKSQKDFKRDFCALTNPRAVLDRHCLDVLKLWMTEPPQEFAFIDKNSSEIKT